VPGDGEFENILIWEIIFRYGSFFAGSGNSLGFGCKDGHFVGYLWGPAFGAGGFLFVDAGRLQQGELFLAIVTIIFVQGHNFSDLNQLSG